MTLDQAKQKVLDMNNETLQNFVNQRKGNDSELSNFARNELADRNRLKKIWMEKAFLKMASKSKAIEQLLVDYNPNNKKVINNYKKNIQGGKK